MGKHRASSARVVVGCAAAICLLTLAAEPARAQQPPGSGPPPSGLRDPFAEVRERQQREAQLRSAEMLGTAKPVSSRAAEAAAVQMREDFRAIQVLRNKVVRQLKSDQPLDYDSLADQTEEINKRASRLRSQLVKEAPEGEKKEPEKEAEFDGAQVTDALVRMCHRIDSFTENPVFKLPDVVDVQQSAKARRDLLDIIRLSSGVNKAAEKMKKTQK